jgi:hypothetical protein
MTYIQLENHKIATYQTSQILDDLQRYVPDIKPVLTITNTHIVVGLDTLDWGLRIAIDIPRDTNITGDENIEIILIDYRSNERTVIDQTKVSLETIVRSIVNYHQIQNEFVQYFS